MYDKLVQQLAKKEGVTEQLKTDNQMQWVRLMNNICNCATEVVNNKLVFV